MKTNIDVVYEEYSMGSEEGVFPYERDPEFLRELRGEAVAMTCGVALFATDCTC
jgi:hypothetical protein